MSLGSGTLIIYDPQAFGGVNSTAGSGLTGGGTQGGDHRFDVVGVSGILVNNDNIQPRWFGNLISGCIVRWNGTSFSTE